MSHKFYDEKLNPTRLLKFKDELMDKYKLMAKEGKITKK
jgi:hypothetical protein